MIICLFLEATAKEKLLVKLDGFWNNYLNKNQSMKHIPAMVHLTLDFSMASICEKTTLK